MGRGWSQSWYTAKTSELRYPKLTTAAGSMDSFIQSIMGGSIAAGGGFATLQSAAMGGYGAATVGGVAAALGGAAIVGIMAADVGAQQEAIEEADHINEGEEIM
jgi:hypothetical protein